MEREISAADANRKFSEFLRSVRDQGTTYVVTTHGKPVAKLMPIGKLDKTMTRARLVLLTRLKSQRSKQIGLFSRDEIYER